MEPVVSHQRKVPHRNRQRPFRLKESQIRSYLDRLKADGRAENTLLKYRTALNQFFDFLGPDKWVYAQSLPQWKQSLITQGYADRSINTNIVAVNGLYDYLGCWEWQLREWMELKEQESPELSRQEYLLLLEEAKKQENIQLYLLVKVLACTELTPGDIGLLSREAVNDGAVVGKTRGIQGDLTIPDPLRDDLLNYAMHMGIRSGPVFLGAGKKPLGRTVISRMIALLGEDAGLEPGKANPRNLRRLYLDTLAEFREEADRWVRSSYRALLAEEEHRVGWRIWTGLGKKGSFGPGEDS